MASQFARRARAAASAALVGFTAVALSPGVTAAAPGDTELFNLQHVFNFDMNEHDPQSEGSVAASAVGTDLEFVTHTVALRNYETGQLIDVDGNPLMPDADPVLAQRDFAVVGSAARGGYIFDITDPEAPEFVTQVTCRQSRNDVAIKKFTDPDTGETRVVLALTQQTGNPCGVKDAETGAVTPGVDVNSPAELVGFRPATAHWAGTPEPDNETADLVYAGTGCSPAQYGGVDVAGKIALVDKFENADGVPDCPTFTFKQKMESAEQAGAIGLVQVDNNDEPSAGNAIDSGIPGMEISDSDGAPIQEAVLDDGPVNVTLKNMPTEGPAMPVLGEGSGGIGVFDITDPYEWEPMYALLTDRGGVHNFIFHPTKPYGYASNGALPGVVNQIPVVDFTDLDNPIVLDGPQTEGGVHDTEIGFDGTRAYAASENNYRIYDITSPSSPRLLSRTPNVGSYAHGVFPSPDGQLMVTNNESLVLGGFLAPGSCPGEGLASYDISDEENPVGPLGYYTPDVTGPVGVTDARPCTSHFGRFAPDTRVLSIGWYIAGTRVIDWSDPANPVEVAAAVLPGTNTWAAKFHKGPYVYAGDIGRGFDVFKWTGEGPAPWEAP